MTTWHILTGEYPPLTGGVADYSRLVAGGLASCGDGVHVWCPELPGMAPPSPGVEVHSVLGSIAPSNLGRLARELERFDAPRRLLVQWVPHAWGWRSMNLPLCEWLWRRARQGDEIDVIVHEAFLAFGEGGLRQQAAAGIHRLMVVALLRAARRVWVTIPAWEAALRPYAPRRVRFACLPVPSTVPFVRDEEGVMAAKAACAGPGELLAGHFGAYEPWTVSALESIAGALASGGVHLLLLGRGCDAARQAIVARNARPEVAARLHAPGIMDPGALSLHLQACDLLVQPYADGASGRRTTLMAALAHARPVLTTTGRLSEPVWGESGAVAAVPAGDAGAMLDALLRLVADRAERERLAQAGRALYDERFDIRHTIAALRFVA